MEVSEENEDDADHLKTPLVREGSDPNSLLRDLGRFVDTFCPDHSYMRVGWKVCKILL